MAEGSKYVTVMIVPEGTEAKTGFRIRAWLLKTIVIGIIALLVGIVLFFSFYGTVLSRAARTEQVLKENEELRRYKYKVGLLEHNLKEARGLVTRIMEMAGIDYDFPEFPDDSTLFASIDPAAGASLARSEMKDWTTPEGLPIQGFITQDYVVDDDEKFHPGIDIAASVGTPVLATASGVVSFAGYDSTYGHMLIIEHNDSISTVYGHNDSLLVEAGSEVLIGSRIALSGNTGISTAPHLHYEVRIHDQPINPLELSND